MPLRALLVLALLVPTLTAQVLLDSNAFASAGGNYSKHVVRDAAGNLWALSITEAMNGDRPLRLLVSSDSGATWSDSGVALNDSSSGLAAPNRINGCALAIDDAGGLHATWSRYIYPSYWRQYYRTYQTTTGVLSPIVDVTSQVGSPSARTAALDIAVDGQNYVWLIAHGTTSWREKLARSSMPYAASATFVDQGNISPSASAQTGRVVIDATGLVHCTYYRNTGQGQYEHRIFDPANGWQAPTILGNTVPSRDLYGRLAADALGNVHAIWVEDSDPTTTWRFRYDVWNQASGWSGTPVDLMSLTPAQHGGITSYRLYDIAVEESSGTAFVAFRDLENGAGALRLAVKGLTDASFTVIQEITTPSTDPYTYRFPSLRGRLFPASDNTGSTLDLTYQFRAAHPTPPFALMFEGNLLGQGPGMELSLPSAVTIGALNVVRATASFEPGAVYGVVFSERSDPGIVLADGRRIDLDASGFLFGFSQQVGNGIFSNNFGILDAFGVADTIIALPPDPAIRGFTFYGAGVTGNPLTPSGFGSISQTLTITIQ